MGFANAAIAGAEEAARAGSVVMAAVYGPQQVLARKEDVRVRRPTTMDVPGDEGDASLWDDFGQKVDLTARLREILLNYPEGTSILKELVQNAVRCSSSR